MNSENYVALRLEDGSPYLEKVNKGNEDEDSRYSEKYVKACIEQSIEIYDYFDLGNNLLIVYDDAHNFKEYEPVSFHRQKQFLESCMIDCLEHETYKLDWSYPIDKRDPIHLRNDTIYTCNRFLYKVQGINTRKLFREIILSDIGGEFTLDASIYIIDIDSGRIFWLYDDRGLDLIAPNKTMLIDDYHHFKEHTLEGTEEDLKLIFE